VHEGRCLSGYAVRFEAGLRNVVGAIACASAARGVPRGADASKLRQVLTTIERCAYGYAIDLSNRSH
jgi:hypothetical protein